MTTPTCLATLGFCPGDCQPNALGALVVGNTAPWTPKRISGVLKYSFVQHFPVDAEANGQAKRELLLPPHEH